MLCYEVESRARTRSENLTGNSPTDLFKILQRDCSEAVEAYKTGHRIYRGIHQTNMVRVIAPKLQPRVSRNTKNYYTLLMDNLSTWSEYPKRSQSIICSTSKSQASSYGLAYLVLPFDGANIGVCSKSDIWDGFRNLPPMDAFSNLLAQLKIPDASYADMMLAILNNKDALANLLSNQFGFHSEDGLREADDIETLEWFFNDVFSPDANDFDLCSIGTVPKDTGEFGREVWTDSKAYLLNPTLGMFDDLSRMMGGKIAVR